MLIQGSVDSRNVFTGDETSSFAVSNIPRCCCSDLHYTVQQSLKEIVLLGKDLVAPEQRDDATQIINVINLAVWNTITPLFGDPHIDLLVNMITGTVRTNVLSRIRAHTASCPDQFDVSNQS
jgi:hypothetical protein